MLTLDLTYPNILDLFPEHLDPKRTESAAFLIWYLENYLRLDAVEAVDAVCDQSGDKGVDGIYINEDANTVDVYQSRISQKKTSSTGDKTLRLSFVAHHVLLGMIAAASRQAYRLPL